MPGPRFNYTDGKRPTGKTKRDHESGKHSRHLSNQAARASVHQQHASRSHLHQDCTPAMRGTQNHKKRFGAKWSKR